MAAKDSDEVKSPEETKDVEALSELSAQRPSLQACFQMRKSKAKARHSASLHDENQTPTLAPEFLAWKKTQNISDSVKVYTVVSGQYPDVHTALQRRGYVENPKEETGFYDFRWSTASKLPENIEDWQTVNHFPEISHISTKLKFSRHIKDFLGANCDEVFPRTHLVKGWDAFVEFDNDYKATFARSLLKRFVAGEEVSLEKVTVSLLATQRTLEGASHMSDLEWKLLRSLTLEVTSRLFAQAALGALRPTEELKQESKELLARLESLLPQYQLDGSNNVWIVKPGGKSRGREIFLHSGLEEIKRRINVKQSWIIQKYIENPLLIHNRKFDIRQWVLITSVQPLQAWFYDECYLRFSAEEYDITSMDNKFAHLTNNSVVKYSEQFSATDIEGCMWSWTQFRDYLIAATGHDQFTESIQPRIKAILLSALRAAQPFIQPRANSFELLGFDLMVDTTLRPWLLEGNTSPAMDYSTPITERLVKQVLEDTIKVVLDHAADPSADTGRFSLLAAE